jgi:16S rRNA processing protein RimM
MATPPSSDDELIELAAVVRAHGLRGELLLKSFNPDSELWRDLDRVVLKLREGGTRDCKVLTARGQHSDQLLLALEGVTTREAAEGLRGSVICVPRGQLPEAGEDEYYLVDLIGLEARDTEGKRIGSVEEVIQYPSVACLKVSGEGGSWEVPDTERYLSAIDLDAGFLTIAHLDELEVFHTPADEAKR